MPYREEPPHEHGAVRQTGVLLINLGTPDAPTRQAVRRYLKEFLWDPRIVEIPRLVWWFILHGIILNIRPAKSAKKYASIWTPEGSPLRTITQRQAQMLRGYLGERGIPVVVAVAMRYGRPSIAEGFATLSAARCDQVLVLPLYPQYAASTTASAFDGLAEYLRGRRHLPGLRFVRSFHDHPAYIEAIAQNIEVHWMHIGRPNFATDRLLMSFHGVPRFHLDRGDPYHCLCFKTARLVGERLGLTEGQYLVTFQSRFGRSEWLQPYTDATLAALAKQGIGRVDVVAPGFAADCLETLEEIAIENKAVFLSGGGRTFNYLPVANDTEPFVHALADIALENLTGWTAPQADQAAAQRDADLSARLARAKGAQR